MGLGDNGISSDGRAWQANPYDSVIVANDPYGSRIEYRWGGINTIVTNVGNKEVDPKKLTAFWFLFGILLLITMVVVAYYTDIPIFIAIFFGGLGIFVSINAIAYASNRTVFDVRDGLLTVTTRPIPIRLSKRLNLLEIQSIRAFHGVKRMAMKKGVVENPYTTLSATYAAAPPVVLLKVEGYKADVDYLAKVVTDTIERYRKSFLR